MAKSISKRDRENPKAEREMCDRMNGIIRDTFGKIVSIRGKLIEQIAKDAEV